MIAADQSNELAALEMDLRMLAGLVDAFHLETGLAQDCERVSKRPAH